MIVIGIDAATTITGWAIIEADGGKIKDYSSGFIDASKLAPRPKEIGSRLDYTFRALESVCTSGLDALALEGGFIGQHPQANMSTGYARGIVYMLAAQKGLPLEEYAPAHVKKVVAGNGRAQKIHINVAVRRVLGIDGLLEENEADALAVALTYLASENAWRRDGDQIGF